MNSCEQSMAGFQATYTQNCQVWVWWPVNSLSKKSLDSQNITIFWLKMQHGENSFWRFSSILRNTDRLKTCQNTNYKFGLAICHLCLVHPWTIAYCNHLLPCHKHSFLGTHPTRQLSQKTLPKKHYADDIHSVQILCMNGIPWWPNKIAKMCSTQPENTALHYNT